SKTGANNIAKIRIFLKNKGNLTVHLEMKTKEIQIKSAIHRLDKQVTNSNKVINPYFLAKFPLLENGLITGTRNRVAKAIK
ncbi:hypothetical protein FKJ73_002753, partial [Enterococcus faecalis]|nr:hypothetical protein [Enterococcus faecalis]